MFEFKPILQIIFTLVMVTKSSRFNPAESSSLKSPPKDQKKTCFYEILGIEKSVSEQEVRKAYYKMALKYHPDRISPSTSDNEKSEIESKFKAVGFAYEVLSSPEKRKIYDRNPSAFSENSADISKFSELFIKITTQDIEDFKRHYIDSAEELEDIMASYMKNYGDISKISEEVFFGSVYEEDRYLEIIKRQIAKNILPDYLSKSPESNKKKAMRVKKAEKEAAEADAYAKELGLFGSKDSSNLTALIQSKQKSRFDDMISNLESKYCKAPGSPSLKRNRSESEFDVQPVAPSTNSKRIKSNFPAKK